MNRFASFAAACVLIGGTSVATGSTASSARPTTPPTTPTQRAAASAQSLVTARVAALHASHDDTFVRHDPISSTNGLQYVPYDRAYKGLPVIGGDFVIATDAAGHVLTTSVAQQAPIDLRSVTPKIDQAQAERTARTRLSTVNKIDSAQLVVDAIGHVRLAWQVVVSGHQGSRPSQLHVFVDALDGTVLRTKDDVMAGEGTAHYNGPNPVQIDTTHSGSQYTMADPNRPGLQCADYSTGQVFTGPDDNWGNGNGTDKETGCVDALFTAQHEWNMLHDWLGRNGIDGNGHGVTVKIGLNDVNAYWTGSEVDIGHNQAGDWIPVLDVLGHEQGHAIDQNTPGSTGSSAVAEFTADVFGAATEWYTNEPTSYDSPDYTVGEEVNLNGSGPIRYMYHPSMISGDPDCYSSSVPNMETHTAAGPGNHWFYLLAEGTNPSDGQPTSPTCNNSTISGLGIQTATKVFYNAMLLKTSNMTYLKYRTATLQAAKNLFPGSCTQFNTVKAAWDAISVPTQSGDPTCTSGTNDYSIAVSPASATVQPGQSATGTISTTVTAGTSQNVTLSTSVSPTEPTINATVSPTQVPSGNTATLSVSTAANTPARQYTVTVTGTGPASHSAVFTLDVSGTGGGSGIANGGFESGALTGWTVGGTAKAAALVNSSAHGGTYAARLGTTAISNGESTLSQTFTAPAGASQLSLWYQSFCPDTVTYDWARVTLTDTTATTTSTPLPKTCTQGQGWKQVTAAIIAGHAYTLTLVNRDDNHPGDATYTQYDDVTTNGTSG